MCGLVYIGVYPAAHAQTRSPPSARRPLPDTRESDPELGEEPQLHGTARTSLDPGRTGERETPPWDWSCAQVLDYFTGTEAVLVRYTSDV